MSTPLNHSVLKGFGILSLFSADRKEISAETVVARLGMSQATAHRFLMTLEHAGALRITRRGRFALGQKIEELGWLAGESGSLSIIVQPEIDLLSSTLNESVMACRLTRFGPTCVAVANSLATYFRECQRGDFASAAHDGAGQALAVPDDP